MLVLQVLWLIPSVQGKLSFHLLYLPVLNQFLLFAHPVRIAWTHDQTLRRPSSALFDALDFGA